LNSRKKFVVLAVSLSAVVLNLIEMSSYIIFFVHITNHNKTIGSNILAPNIIKQRNQESKLPTTFMPQAKLPGE
jgi:hypothetical protein